MKYYSGLEKFQSQQVMYEILGKQSIFFQESGKNIHIPGRVIFRNAENFIDIGECTKTLSLLNALMLGYLRKVQRICGEFLTDMPNDLPYILCCDWNFPPRVKHGEQLA